MNGNRLQWMEESHWAPNLGCEDGLHKETQMGAESGTRCLIQWAQLLQGCCPGKAYGLLSPMLHSTDWISFQKKLGMHTYRLPHLRRTTMFVVQSLGLRNVGHEVLIHRALYGRKSAGSDFRNHLWLCMQYFNLKSCPTNPDVWMQPSNKADGFP